MDVGMMGGKGRGMAGRKGRMEKEHDGELGWMEAEWDCKWEQRFHLKHSKKQNTGYIQLSSPFLIFFSRKWVNTCSGRNE